jgi:hypothetical protein
MSSSKWATKIGIYVPDKAAKTAYKTESYNVRAQVGMSVIRHALARYGYTDIGYASRQTVDRYDIILISITSQVDWWQTIAERLQWPRGKYISILGGPGVLNVRPHLDLFDIFVFGRGESIIGDLIFNHGDYDHPSIARAATFNPDRTYTIAQAPACYPHDVPLENGKQWREASIGCPYKCYFCSYTWHRRHVSDRKDGHYFSSGAGIFAAGNRERTIIDLLKLPPSQWQGQGSLRIVGLDGLSERLRRQITGKRVTAAMLREFLAGLATIDPPHQVKIYNIVGLPTETDDDWLEFVETLRDVDGRLARTGKQWSIVLHNTPHRPMPATPAALYPVPLVDYRGRIARTLRGRSPLGGNIFYQGNRFWAVESMGTDSLSSVILDMLVLRGTEQDAALIRGIAANKQFWSGSSPRRMATLEQYADVARLADRLTPEDLPTRYLRTYAGHTAMMAIGERALSGAQKQKAPGAGLFHRTG